MNSNANPPFIDHYINQQISEDCIIELNQLGQDYRKKKKNILENENEKYAAAYEYKKYTGEEFEHTPRNQLIKLDKDYQQKAKDITSKHAEREGVSFDEWKDPTAEKTVEEKSKETTEHIDASQDNMLQMKQISQEKEKKNQTINEEKEKNRQEFLQQVPGYNQQVTVEHNLKNEKSTKSLSEREIRKQEFKEQVKDVTRKPSGIDDGNSL